MAAPDVIYLQWYGDQPTARFDEDDNEVPIPEEEMESVYPNEVTWCVDRIFDGDIVYVRADVAERERDGWKKRAEYESKESGKLIREVTELRSQVERLRTLIAGWSMRLMWADGLDPCIEEMREEAGR